MDTQLYFIRCKGEEKGPYAFYQIQQMRTEDVLTRDQFTHDEWEQFEQFLDDGGDVPRPKVGAPAIRRFSKNDKKPTERRVLVGLTYLSYALGGFIVLAALVQGEQHYVLQSRPMFWLGLLFSGMLCHTVVDRLCRRQLMRYPRSSRLDLLVKYVMVLCLFALVVGALLGLENVFHVSAFNSEQLLDTAKKYLSAGAAFALYRPFYLGFLAEHEYLTNRGKSSVPWLVALLGFVVLLAIYLAPSTSLDYPAVMTLRQNLFVSEPSDIEASTSDWKFPVRLGDTQKTVQRILGKPQISGTDYVYHSLRISFDQENHVSRLHFDGRQLRASIFAKKLLVAGLTPASGVGEMKSVFGAKTVTFGDEVSETHIWELPNYRVSACFWTKNNPADRANSVKWMEVSFAQ